MKKIMSKDEVIGILTMYSEFVDSETARCAIYHAIDFLKEGN